MKYKIVEGAFSQLDILLDKNEYVDSEADAFICANKEVKIEGSAKKGGLFNNLKKSLLTGESMFSSRVTALSDGTVVKLGAAILGHIQAIDIDSSHEYIVSDGAYLADVGDVEFEIVKQKMKTALFTNSGFRILKFKGNGKLFINGFGEIIEYDLDGSNDIIVDNQNVLAWSSNIEQNVQKASKGMISSMTSGEGLISRFSGVGKVYVQSHSLKRQTEKQQKYIITTQTSS